VPIADLITVELDAVTQIAMEKKENMGFLLGRAGKALHYRSIPTVLDGRFHHIGDDIPKLDRTCRGNSDYLGRRSDAKAIDFGGVKP
jgi:hypothetical protein